MSEMRPYSAILLSLLMQGTAVIGADPDSTTLAWLTDFESARQAAKKSDNPILIEFTGSDWCAPCIRLEKQVFKQEPFLSFAREHLVLVYCDLPFRKKISPEQKDHNEALSKRYKAKVYPVILLVDHTGKAFFRQDGYRGETGESFVRKLRVALATHEDTPSK